MYGIINKSIEELVKEKFGLQVWETILEKSNIQIDFFISNCVYDDAITYQLVSSISEVTNIPVALVLETFGEWWIMRTSKDKYGSLLQAGGNNLKEFLVRLPIFHNRVMLIYPNHTPPEFKVSNIESNSIHLHYFSNRVGLQDFVRGLLIGLSKLFNTITTIELLQSRNDGHTHEIFKVSW